MKLTIFLCSLLFAAIAAKDVYVEGSTTVNSPGAVAVDPAAQLGVNEAASYMHMYMYFENAATDSPGASLQQQTTMRAAQRQLGVVELLVNPPECDRTYSSVNGNDARTIDAWNPWNGMRLRGMGTIRGNDAWNAQTRQW